MARGKARGKENKPPKSGDSRTLPYYPRTFEGYCDALIKGLLDPDDYTMWWIQEVERGLKSGEIDWEPIHTEEEKAQKLAAVERVGKAIGFVNAQKEQAEAQAKAYRHKLLLENLSR